MLTANNERIINEMVGSILIEVKVTAKLIDDLEKEIFLMFMDDEGITNKKSMVKHYEESLYRNLEILKVLKG